MENTPEGNKLPDLVVNSEPSETLNAVTNDQRSAVPNLVGNLDIPATFNAVTNDRTTTLPVVDTNGQSDIDLNDATDTPLVNSGTPVTPGKILPTETIAPVTPENTEITEDNTNDITETDTITPVGHDTATTDEEEVAEALLALSNLPDMDSGDNSPEENASLMPINRPCKSIDVNPVKIKLSTDDVNNAIE